jgi:hypothetical protein
MRECGLCLRSHLVCHDRQVLVVARLSLRDQGSDKPFTLLALFSLTLPSSALSLHVFPIGRKHASHPTRYPIPSLTRLSGCRPCS